MEYLSRKHMGRAQPPGGSPSDRRRACRSRAVVREIVLGWQKGDTSGDLPASLENVSLEGCMARSRNVPAIVPGDPIWFGIAGSHPAERIEGILIEARRPFIGGCRVRIRFIEPLPYATFKHLVYGPQGPATNPGGNPVFETKEFWK
jgi:hypothetical protein